LTVAERSIKKLRGTFGSIISSGFTPGEINPLTLRKIYCSVVLPKAFYGAQLWSNCSKADVKGLEIAHRKCLKQLSTFSSNCDTTCTLTSLDMESAEELMDFYKLQFLGQLCRLSPYFLVKQVFVQRLIRHISYGNVMFGFIPDICRLVERYGLGHCIDTCIYVSTG